MAPRRHDCHLFDLFARKVGECMSEPVKNSGKKILPGFIRWAGTLVSMALFLWLISRQQWDVVLAKATGIRPWIILLVLVLYLLSFGFNTLRWCILLWAQDVRITFWQAFRMTWAGNFASQFLLSTIGGDGLRMVGIFRYTDPKTIGIGSVIPDRIIKIAAMDCLTPGTLLIFCSSLGKLFSRASFAAPLGWLQRQFGHYFPKVIAAFKTWAQRPWAFAYAFLAAWPSNLLPMAGSYFIARQLGMDVSFWQVIGVQVITYFITVLPISFNGYGLREVTFTTLYIALGASIEQASTLALVTRFLMLLATVPGAFWLSGAVTHMALNDAELNGFESDQ